MVDFLPSSWRRDWLPGFFLVAVTLAAYQPIWHAGFIWDDDAMLLNNALIHQAGGWYRAWFNRAADDFVPVTITSLWLEWRLWGANPLGYHLDNLLLHVGSALLLWHLLLRLKIPGAWLAAAVFAVHPVNVESVAWITQRKNTLTMLFFLTALRCYLTFEDSGRRRWYWLSTGLYFLALMGKTAVVPLPIVLLGLAWWRRGRIERKDVQRNLIFIALAAAGSFGAIWIQHRANIVGEVVRTDSFWRRLAGAGWVLWFYLGKALLPLNLSFVYPRWEIPAGNPLSYVPLVFWVAGLWMCWRCRDGWGQGALFALGYFSVMLVPVLGFLNIYFMRFSLVADHWQYFAIIGPIALATALIIRKPAAGAALLLVLGVLTWKQCGVYANAETLWQATLRQNPNCWMAHYNFGLVLFQEGRMDDAMSQYEQTLEIKPDYAKADNNLGLALAQTGRMDEAIRHFQAALQSEPANTDSHINLGTALLQKGRADEAMGHFQKVLELSADSADAHYGLGNAFSQKGMTAEAILQYQKTLQIKPVNPEVQNNLAWLLATCPEASLRNGSKAVELARQANDLTGGGNPVILHTLAAAFAETGRLGDALQSVQKAIALAQTAGRQDLADKFRVEMKRYQAGLPLHQ